MSKQCNVVIIDDNRAVLEGVKKYFSGNDVIKVVATFGNGKEGLNFLLENSDKYDLVLLDILLPNIDGISILEKLKQKDIKKKIIVMSSFKDDYTVRMVQFLNVNYFMLKPVDPAALEARIMDLIKNKSEIKLIRDGNIELNISSLLHDLGIPSHVRGFKYIKEGILLLYANDNVVTFVTKDIYPEIAKVYETTSSRVERAIRHAIEISWIRGDLKLLEEIFGNSIDVEKGKPTNSEFLNTIADRFKMRKGEFIG